MDTFQDLYEAVYSDLTANSDSTLYSLTAVKLAVNRAYDKAAALFRWSKTEDAQVTYTQLNIDYYDFPQTWRPDSIWKLTVDGIDYGDPLTFKDFLYERENDMPSGLEHMWATQWTRFFICPTPTVADLEIDIWGVEVVEWLTDDTDETIFSYSMRDCNDAIVNEAVAILRAKAENERSSQFRSVAAKEILISAWNKMRQEQQKYEKTTPIFEVPDFFARGRTRSKVGKFNI